MHASTMNGICAIKLQTADKLWKHDLLGLPIPMTWMNLASKQYIETLEHRKLTAWVKAYDLKVQGLMINNNYDGDEAACVHQNAKNV